MPHTPAVSQKKTAVSNQSLIVLSPKEDIRDRINLAMLPYLRAEVEKTRADLARMRKEFAK